MSFELPKLQYTYDALEPHIDAKTMEIHHTKHHAAYTKNFNTALSESNVNNVTIEEIFQNISNYNTAIRNNGGGYYNHNLFWRSLSPDGGGNPKGELANGINRDFGSFENFKAEFSKAAATRFGSGWAWLIKDANGKLKIGSTPNQDNPLMNISEFKGKPIIALDVWEHAYYLNYQNRRPDFIEAFWNIINWEEANRLFIS